MMKIDEAIEVLPQFFELCSWPRTKDQEEALKLGIEALKEVKKHRGWPLHLDTGLLPGETEKS